VTSTFVPARLAHSCPPHVIGWGQGELPKDYPFRPCRYCRFIRCAGAAWHVW